MKKIILFICLLPVLAWGEAGTGFELGVARLSDGKGAMMGTSWAYHFEFHPDNLLGFFGEAGVARGEDDGDKLMQTNFMGGMLFHLLPFTEVRLGVTNSIAEIERNGIEKKERELGPLVGASVYSYAGAFKFGINGTIVRTPSLQSSNLGLMLLVMF